jgi:hypothetical protein
MGLDDLPRPRFVIRSSASHFFPSRAIAHMPPFLDYFLNSAGKAALDQ